MEWLDKLSIIAKNYEIPIHMDGARLMNAAVASKVHPSRIVKDMDSVCFCLSKGLGAPIGSVLLGTKSFIERFLLKYNQIVFEKLFSRRFVGQTG